MSVIVDIADAVVAELNDHSFSKSFTATREYLPTHDLQTLTGLKVVAIPSETSIANESRSNTRDEHRIEIGVVAKLDAVDAETIDGYVALCEEIADYLKRRTLTDYENARPIGVEIEPVFDALTLDTHRVFLSVVSITYRVLN